LLEARNRIEQYWQPYHAELQSQLTIAHRTFGSAVLVDFHSMPHEALDGVSRSGQPRPDVVLGDRFGASANSDIVDLVEASFAKAGFNVARNTPFAGAYITQTYGRPSRNQHAVQIELDRSLYMNERSMTPNESFQTIRTALLGVMADIAEAGCRTNMPLAAE